MLCRHITLHAAGLLEKGDNLVIDGVRAYHPLDWDRIIIEDGNQTLLNKIFVYFVWMFDEEVNPSWKVYFIVLEVLDDVLN